MMKKKLVITAGVDPAVCDRLAAGVDGVGSQPPLEIHALRADDLERAVGAVAEERLVANDPASGRAAKEVAPHPVVFFAAMPRGEIAPFIEAYKSAGGARAVFASLTPNNLRWTWRELIEHLLEEHEHFLAAERRRERGEDEER